MKTLKPKFTKEMLEFFRNAGSIGGKKSSANMTKEERHRRARKAVAAREKKRGNN